jgi:hypothetical protein
MNDDIERLKEAEKEANEVNEEPAEPTPRQRGPHWGAGIALIVLGLVFLLSNVTGFHLDNWWALFILIPAAGSFSEAWRNYQRHGRFTRSSRNSLLWGIIISLVAFTFLLDLDWGLIWPVFLIIGGLGALMGAWFD